MSRAVMRAMSRAVMRVRRVLSDSRQSRIECLAPICSMYSRSHPQPHPPRPPRLNLWRTSLSNRSRAVRAACTCERRDGDDVKETAAGAAAAAVEAMSVEAVSVEAVSVEAAVSVKAVSVEAAADEPVTEWSS